MDGNFNIKVYVHGFDHFTIRHRNFSNNTGTTHYDSLQGSYWADQKDMTMW